MLKSNVNKEIVKSCLTSNYLPAMLREHKSGWIIEYYAENPLSKKLERKKFRLTRLVSRYKSVKDARLHANKMVMALNLRLSTGWNPFFVEEDSRLYTPIGDVFEAFIKEKNKELRSASMVSYNSFSSNLLMWIQKNTPIEYISMVNKTTISRFMDYIYNERNVSTRTYNNYLRFGKSFFNWAKERCYVKENPFELIKMKQNQQKQRIIIPHDYREKITNYLLSNPREKNYLIVLKLIYSALMRPAEIRKIKIENIDLQGKNIIVPCDISKNKKQRIISLTDDIYNDLAALNLSKYPKNFYLFGKDIKPNLVKMPDTYLRRYWDKLRIKLKLPQEMQQYSFRDTGIFEMLKSGIDPLSVKQHADHHSLEMTTIYSNHADPNLAKIIREKAPAF